MAKKKQVKCSKCGRKFTMAAHLARHMNTTHGSKAAAAKKKAAVRKKTAATKSTKRRSAKNTLRAKHIVATPRQSAATGFGSWLTPMRAYQSNLIIQRDILDSRIQAIDQALVALGSGGTTKLASTIRRRRGGPRTGSLKSYIERVLRGRVRPMAVKDITAEVLKAGYQSKDKTLAHSVGVSLADMQKVVKVERGMYRMK